MQSKWLFGRREKILLIAVLVLLAALSVKSLLLDPYVPQGDLERQLAEEALEGLKTDGPVRWRVIAVNDLRTPRDNLTYQKVVELRRYLLYIIPFGQGSVYR